MVLNKTNGRQRSWHHGTVEDHLRLGEHYAIALFAAIVPEPTTGVIWYVAIFLVVNGRRY